uniref:hypothetical protein n=1 Tax=Euplotes vannus TaxID=5939 RepID=UPI002E778DF5|nr:hypothetical protein V3A05_mgp02 [Euplotes vannus]UPM52087.1 hypothetical protein [Euplotes vannus]
MLLIFYQNEWIRFIVNGRTLRQFILLRWVMFFGFVCELCSVWRRLINIMCTWLPALGFYFFLRVVTLKPLNPLPLSELLMPLPSLKPVPERRIFNWTRRYLVFLTWFLYFIYLLPLNQNSRIVTFPHNSVLRTTVWMFLWL